MILGRSNIWDKLYSGLAHSCRQYSEFILAESLEGKERRREEGGERGISLKTMGEGKDNTFHHYFTNINCLYTTCTIFALSFKRETLYYHNWKTYKICYKEGNLEDTRIKTKQY